MSTTPPLPIAARWLSRADALRRDFEDADPFPLLVLDDFLEPELAEALVAEFPAINAMPKSRDYMFGDKHELSSVERSGSAGRCFYDAMTSPAFATFLREATGYDVFVDPTFLGGGFHQGGDGSFLDMHVDFNVHPLHRDWLRTLNILVYLNHDWRDEYGGQLLVRRSRAGEARSIEPAFNRALIMLTSDDTYHGYRRMSLPSDVTRKSVAAYAYRPVDAGSVRARTTGWAPERAGIAKRVVARHYNRLVTTKNRFFGVGTAKNR